MLVAQERWFMWHTNHTNLIDVMSNYIYIYIYNFSFTIYQGNLKWRINIEVRGQQLKSIPPFFLMKKFYQNNRSKNKIKFWTQLPNSFNNKPEEKMNTAGSMSSPTVLSSAVYSKTELQVRSDQELILWPLSLLGRRPITVWRSGSALWSLSETF